MNRDQQLVTAAGVYRDWVHKHLGEPGFDPDDGYSTQEQDDDYLAMIEAAIPGITGPRD